MTNTQCEKNFQSFAESLAMDDRLFSALNATMARFIHKLKLSKLLSAAIKSNASDNADLIRKYIIVKRGIK